MIYDAHVHHTNMEKGGFIIGLEGTPYFEGTFNNNEVLQLHDPCNYYISFYYVSKDECYKKTTFKHKYLKYHPRREKYGIKEVIESIEINSPKAVIIDTLNEPYWQPYDYWSIAKRFPEISFVFSHAGGYLINDFIKICHFQTNVWIDFALTQTVLGCYGSKETGLPYVEEAIKYALNSVFKERVLLASDYPFFEQKEVFLYYEEYKDILNRNFLCLFEKIK